MDGLESWDACFLTVPFSASCAAGGVAAPLPHGRKRPTRERACLRGRGSGTPGRAGRCPVSQDWSCVMKPNG